MPRFLHAVCGTTGKNSTTKLFAEKEWEEVRMDTDPGAGADVQGTLLDMSALGEDRFEGIFIARALERLYFHEVLDALRNTRAALAPEGHLVVVCADIQQACALAAEGKLLEPVYTSKAGPVAPIDILYGFRPALASGRTNLACRCGFTSQSLAVALGKAGFASIWAARNPSAFSVVAVAVVEKKPESTLAEIAHMHFG